MQRLVDKQDVNKDTLRRERRKVRDDPLDRQGFFGRDARHVMDTAGRQIYTNNPVSCTCDEQCIMALATSDV